MGGFIFDLFVFVSEINFHVKVLYQGKGKDGDPGCTLSLLIQKTEKKTVLSTLSVLSSFGRT